MVDYTNHSTIWFDINSIIPITRRKHHYHSVEHRRVHRVASDCVWDTTLFRWGAKEKSSTFSVYRKPFLEKKINKYQGGWVRFIALCTFFLNFFFFLNRPFRSWIKLTVKACSLDTLFVVSWSGEGETTHVIR